MILKVDVDHGRRVPRAELAARLERAGYELVDVEDRRSPSGRGWHRTIRVHQITTNGRVRFVLGARETVALQLLCGSDPRREAYNWVRAGRVDAGLCSPFFAKRWNVFYRRRA
jgi:hypothetical protein